EQVLEEDLQRIRQARDAGKTGLLERGEAIYLDCLRAGADLGARVEAVSGGHTNPGSYFAQQQSVHPLRCGVIHRRDTYDRAPAARCVISMRKLARPRVT